MMKMVLMVCLSLALMAIYTEATSPFDEKELTSDGLFEIGEGIDMEPGEMGSNKRSSTSRRLPYACRRTCNCDVMSRRACNYCKYLKNMCIRIYGNVVDA
ncbi:hypothetical protein ElyMa_003129800 [Elysia marginata]|uniref:Uncharacterized protein n=1 Tax=Elysia marginata TaxID=1093978 RepID=A0AAV4IS26_9GAST|nr:hypothetical protein ElyMa_003129800 [Elysia marginata]